MANIRTANKEKASARVAIAPSQIGEKKLSTEVINSVESYSLVISSDYCHLVASEKPMPIKPKPTSMFQAPIPGIGYAVELM